MGFGGRGDCARGHAGAVNHNVSERDPSLLVVDNSIDTKVQETAMTAQNQELSEQQFGYFDIEPRLPLHPNKEDFEIGRQAQKEAMEREDLNYFCLSREGDIYQN